MSSSASVPIWLPAGVALTGAAVQFVVTLACLLVVDGIARAKSRRVSGVHWTALAREVWTARFTRRIVSWAAVAFAFGGGTGVQLETPCLGSSVKLFSGIGGVLLATALAAAFRSSRTRSFDAHGSASLRSVGLWIVLGPQQLGVLGWILCHDELDARAAWVVVFLFGAALLALACGWRVALALRLAQPASARLQAIMDVAAARVRVAPRQVVEVELERANAFAFPLSGTLAFTRGALHALDDPSLTAIAVHELGHLCEPRRISWARWCVSMGWIPLALIRPLVTTYGAAGGLLAVAPLVLASLGFRAIARRMEERSDAMAVDHEGDPGVYARALERLYQHGLIPAVGVSRRTSHPHLYDRLIAAGVQPDYPRPDPPAWVPGLLGFALVVAVSIAVAAAQAFAYGWYLNDEERQHSPWIAGIVSGCEARVFDDAGYDRIKKGDRVAGERWYKIAHALDPSGRSLSSHSVALAYVGRCDDAEEQLGLARKRVIEYDGDFRSRESVAREIESMAWAVEQCRQRGAVKTPVGREGDSE